jgi:hypothetical protein
MDVFDEDLLHFWKLMDAEKVHYIMVGGVAVNLHGYLRTTADVDVWIDDTVENRANFGRVLTALGYPGINMETLQIIPGWTDFHLSSGVKLDILIAMKGIEAFSFSECLHVSFVAEIESLKVPFLHINQLIANKKAVNRPKDQIDVAALEKIRELLRQQQENNPPA